MLSSAACQKLERYAQIALAKCGVSATLAHAANEATTPIILSPFVSSSYDNFTLAAAVSAANAATNVAADDKTTDKGALNRCVLLSADLWRQVNAQLIVSTTEKSADSTHVSINSVAVFTDGLVVAAALAVQMVQWEAEHFLLPSTATKKGASSSSLNAQRAAYLRSLLVEIASALRASGRDRAIESPSLTLAVSTLASAAVNAVLGNILTAMDAMSMGEDNTILATFTIPLLEIAALSLQQLRRAGAAYPLPKLFTIRVAAQQLKQLGSGYINAIKDTANVPVARMGAIGKMRVLQRMGLLYGLLRDYANMKATSAPSTDDEITAMEQCKEAIIDAATPYVSTRTARHHIYFRTEADEQRLAMSGCTDIPTQVAAIDFVLTPPMDPDAIKSMQRMNQSPAAKAAISVTLQSWTGSTELIFIAFCRDGSWSSFAAEARRRILAEQAAKKSRASKKALKEEEKALQAQIKQKAVDALLKAKEEEHKETMRLVKEANDKSNGITKTSANDTDNDDAKSAKSSQSEALSARSGNTASEMSKAESDVRSVMSAASFQSYATFLSVVDSEAIANEQRMQHESADGNTNLPVIFMELACLSLYQFLEAVGGSGNNAFILRPTEAEGGMPLPATIALDILPLNVVDAAWSAISGIFGAFAAFIDAQPRTGLICFSLSEDVQYNKGLGYQSLGLLFARILVPALLKERACSGASEDASAAAAIEALHVSQTLTIYERVASQAINQNLAAVLDMCCNALQPADGSQQSQSSATAATQDILQRLLVSIVSRLGQTNQLGLLLKAIITDHEAELKKRQLEDAARKALLDEEDDDDEEEAAAKAATAKAGAVDREMALRRTVLPATSSLRLLATPCFREAFGISVRRALDPEGLLETLGNALASLLLDLGGDDEEDDAPKQEPTDEEVAQSFRSLVHLRGPVLLGAASLVFKGLLPSNLVAFNIFEKCAEIEAYLLLFVEGSLYPTMLASASNSDDAEEPSNEFAKKFVQQLAISKSEVVAQPKVKQTHLKRLFLSVSEALLVLRDTMYNVCLKDLGVDQLEKVLEVMNESLWQISDLSNDAEGAAEPRFIGYGNDSILTLEAIETNCVDPDATTNPSTGALALHVLVRLAAQRLVLVNSVGKLLTPLSIEKDQAVADDEASEATPSYAAAAKALAMYVGQHVAESVSAEQRHLRLLPAEWRSVAAALGPKRWKKCLAHASTGEGCVASSILAQNIPTELIVAATVSTSEEESGSWASARAQWRCIGCVPEWATVIPALAKSISAAAALKKGSEAAVKSIATVLEEALRLSTTAHHALTNSSTLNALAEPAFVEAISSASTCHVLLKQLVTAATAAAPSSAAATSIAFLAALYDRFAASIVSQPTSVSVLATLLSEQSYLLPAGAASNAHLAAALKAFISLGKALLKAEGSDKAHQALLADCACLMVGKHLPVYCDAADLAKLASKALARVDGNSQPLLLCHLATAGAAHAASQQPNGTEGDDNVATPAGDDPATATVSHLTSISTKLAADKSIVTASRPLWALAASQLLRCCTSTTAKANKGTAAAPAVKAVKSSSPTTVAEVAERLSSSIISSIETSLLQSISSSTAATPEPLRKVLTELEGLSTLQRVRFTSFLPVILALVARVTLLVTGYSSDKGSSSAQAAAIGSIISGTLQLARLPLPALLNEASHQDATMSLVFAIACNSRLPSSAFSSVMATLNSYATHRPLVLARRAALLPSLLCSLLNSLFAKLNDSSSDSADGNLLSSFNSTLAVIVRQCEFETSVSSSTTPLTISPSTTPKSFVCCAIATAIFGTVSGRNHIGLFARFSNELDYLAKDLVVEMLKGRLPLTAQKRLVDVTVERNLKEEKKDREKKKSKAQLLASANGTSSAAAATVDDEERVAGKKSAREDGGEEAEEREGSTSSSDAEKEHEEDAAAAVIALSASVAGKPAPIAVRKSYTIKRHRKEPAGTRKVSQSSFADLCFAALGTSSSNDAQNLLRQEIMRIRDEDGRAIFRPTN